MKASTVAHVVGIILFLVFGSAFTFFSGPVREYYFNAYKKGAEKTGFMLSSVESYPQPYVFVIAGIISLGISGFLIFLLVRKLI